MLLPADHRSRATDTPRAPKQGARRLMAAVLENALAALERDLNDAEVWEWIDTHGSNYLYSFDSICEALLIDPDAARRALHRWRVAMRMRGPQLRGRSTITLRYLIVHRPVENDAADGW